MKPEVNIVSLAPFDRDILSSHCRRGRVVMLSRPGDNGTDDEGDACFRKI